VSALALVVVVAVPVVKANLSFLDTVALKAGEVFGLNLAGRVDIGELTERALGAFPGGNIDATEFNVFTSANVFTQIPRGTTTAATFTSNAITLTEADLLKGVITLPITTASTVTLPATSTLNSFVKQPNAQASVKFAVIGGGNIAATIVGGTGMYSVASSTIAVTNQKVLTIDFLRTSTSSDVYMMPRY
jgi:hypothetical protein